MHKAVRASTAAILAMAVSGFSLIGCGLNPPPAFDPVVANQAEDQAARGVKPDRMYPLPTTLEDLTTQPSETGNSGTGVDIAHQDVPNPRVHLRKSTPATTGPVIPQDLIVQMSLANILQRSVLNSSEGRVASFDPAIAKTRVLEAEARFDPTMFINAKYEHQDTPFPGQTITVPGSTSRTETLQVERGEVYTLEPGIKQVLPSGGEVSLSYQFQYNYLTPQRFVLNPYWDDQLKFQLTQPLLRNAGFAVNQARITIARNDARVSLLDFRKTLEDNIAELEKDYWQLQEADQEVKIQEDLLRLTRATAEILFEQFRKGGAVSRVQTSQAQASIRSREAVLIRARARLRDISDDIKRRMNDPQFPVASPIVVMPLEGPSEHKIEFLLDDQVKTALLNRLELGQQQLRINDSDVALAVAINNAYPKLDLTAAITLEGVGSVPNFQHTGAANFANTFHNQWEADGHLGFSIGLMFELPIGNREARAIARRAYLQHYQAVEQYRNLIDQVTLDVTQAVREVNTSWNEIGARRQARFAQADELGAYEDRRANGEALTPTFVQLILDAQERLAEAQREEALAVASYEVAIARLERAKGTLLRYNNIMLAEDQFRGMDR